jgi:cellulose synthase/poly-beta-1,6-N-acetylglucosamine synthase-like glycosyltransferase
MNNYFAGMLAAGIIGIQLFFYAVLFFYYRVYWYRSLMRGLKADGEPRTFFSIIIPVRNEERHIVSCLRSVCDLHYPSHLYEVIVVDDHSTDRTVELVKTFPQVKLIHLSDHVQEKVNSYKKIAISTAIHTCRGEYIVTTDGDCEVSPDWLLIFNRCIQQKKPAIIAAPVSIKSHHTLLQKFETIDFMMLQAITAAAVHSGAHSMANGANLCYRKSAFEEVGGFSQIDDIASGDDMLLLQKISAKYPGDILYCHSAEALVTTAGTSSFRAFINQRIRWASKGKYYKSVAFKLILLIVYIFNLSLLCIFIAGFWDFTYMGFFLTAISVKALIECLLLIPAARFYNKKRLLSYFLLLQPMHILYIVIAGTLGNFGKYHWKGRKVR